MNPKPQALSLNPKPGAEKPWGDLILAARHALIASREWHEEADLAAPAQLERFFIGVVSSFVGVAQGFMDF